MPSKILENTEQISESRAREGIKLLRYAAKHTTLLRSDIEPSNVFSAII